MVPVHMHRSIECSLCSGGRKRDAAEMLQQLEVAMEGAGGPALPGDCGSVVALRDVITCYSPQAVIITSEDFAPQLGAMHKSIVSIVIFHPQSQPAVALCLIR